MLLSGKKTDKELKQIFARQQKEQKENHLKWYHYLIATLFILVGAVFILYSEIDIPFICLFSACVFALAGVVCVLSYCLRDVATGYYRLDLVYGVIACFAALIFYTKQDVIGTYFPILAGSILFANGVVKLQHSIDMKRIDRKMKKVTEIWLVVMIFALVCVAAGLITVYMTPEESRTLFVFTGIAFIVAGASDVFTHIVFNSKVRIFRSGEYDTEEEHADETAGEPVVEDVSGAGTDIPETYDEPVIAEEEIITDNVMSQEPETEPDEENGNDAADPQT